MSAAVLFIKVLCLSAVTFTGRTGRQEASPGDVVEMPEEDAESLIRFGAATPAPPSATPAPGSPLDDAETLAAAEAARLAAEAEAAAAEKAKQDAPAKKK